MAVIRYQPHIDGMRALAVLGVFLAHAKVPFSHGGFVGVDVFFVISGYLITAITVSELNLNKFSIQRWLGKSAQLG